MRLFLEAQSERGKPVTKSGNEYITLTLTNDKRQKFDITFKGEALEVMSYADARMQVIPYMKEWCNECMSRNYTEGK